MVQERVVTALAVAKSVGLVALQADHLAENRRERLEVIVLAGGDPALLTEDRRARDLLHQRLRQADPLVVLPLQFTNYRTRIAVAVLRQLGFASCESQSPSCGSVSRRWIMPANKVTCSARYSPAASGIIVRSSQESSESIAPSIAVSRRCRHTLS